MAHTKSKRNANLSERKAWKKRSDDLRKNMGYATIVVLNNRYAIVSKKIEGKKKYGLYEWGWGEIASCVYDSIDNFELGFARITRDGKVGLLSAKGLEILVKA